jgi:PAS domain S-box-containing protein
VTDLFTSDLETLKGDGEFVLYRDPIEREGSRFLLLEPASDAPNLRTLGRLEHEYALRGELDASWSLRPVALVRKQGRTILLLEDPGGVFLDCLLGQPLELIQVLRLATGIAAALRCLHGRGLVHKDLKPANILVEPATGKAWLAGFGIASHLPPEGSSADIAEVCEGTFAYMAPEQTGRMNRSIDSRSDLYSFGVTLYEMLTGALPFSASDPIEWVHCHVAREPMPPNERNKGIPGPISAIVMKLLAKNAEERYQTAAGVEADLKKCRSDWESRGCIDSFLLGAHDPSERLPIPQRVYGRDREIKALLDTFERVVASGRPELALVSGNAGIGKSSVVKELQKALILPRGAFMAGKFDQQKRDIPYGTLGQMFQTLVHQILGKNEEELKHWRDAIREATEPNGQLIVNLIPELELVIGPQPPAPELPAQETRQRFQAVFGRFLGVFARKEHPLILFLDDLQWVDTATPKVLEQLASRPETQYLLVIGAYRDNEVGRSHPLRLMLDSIRRAEVTVNEIALKPLSLRDINLLIADALDREQARASSLGRLAYQKTAGNPFFAIQFLTALAEEGLVEFDPQVAAWRWDLRQIRARKFTDNVLDLMITKVRRLPAATQVALKQLAGLGDNVGIDTLAIVNGRSEESIRSTMWKAVRAGLVLEVAGSYKFLHDRVQEAAYSLIPEGERAALHLRIGRLFASQTAPEEIEEKIFEIVNQLDRGTVLIDSLEERQRVAELNLIAGKRAKASTAYASAMTYLVAGRKLLTEDCWERQYPLTFALEFQLAECEFLTGDFAGSEERLLALSRCAANLVDNAAVTRLQTELYARLDRSDRAVEVTLEYLRRVGIDWSLHPTEDEVRQEYERIWRRLGSRPIEKLIDLPQMTDPASRATLDVLTTVEETAYFTDENLRCLAVARMANLSLEHGNSDGSCVAYVHLGWLLTPRFGDHQAGFRFAKVGLDLVEKRGLERFSARACQCFGYFVNLWSKPLRTSVDSLRRSFVMAQETGDLRYAVYSWDRLVTILLAVGDPLDDVQREAEKGLEFARKAKFGFVVDIMTGQLQLIQTLRGLTPSFSSFNDAGFDEVGFEQYLEADPQLIFAARWYWIRKLQARFYAGDYASALTAVTKAGLLLGALPGLFESTELLYYAGLVRAAHFDAASLDEQVQHLAALRAYRKQLDSWAENCPENYGNRASLIGAEIARIEGHDLDAMRSYDEAIKSACENGFVQNEGIANELAARFYLKRGFDKIAHVYLRDARSCYLRWGALGKVKQLDQCYPRQDEPSPHETSTTIARPFDQLDLLTVVKASQAVSGEILLGKLIETLMVIAVEHAGAERGLLILPRKDDYQIEAEATTSREKVLVDLGQAPAAASKLPMSILNYVIRTRQSVIVDDALVQNPFSEDENLLWKRPRSILCVPLIKQTKLMGVLYLENRLAPRVFTPNHLATLELLASQAAISLDHARLYADLTQENSDRRKAEEALRASEERWRRFFESSSAGIALNAPDGRYITANLALQKILGYTDEELQGLNVLNVTHEGDRSATEGRLAGCPEGQQSVHRSEKRFIRKDGVVIWADVSTVFVPTTGNTPGFFANVVVDITERKRAEANLAQLNASLEKRVAERTIELARSEEKFRALFEGTSQAVVLHDENGILEANPSWLRLLGYSSLADVIGKHAAELSAPIQPGGETAEILASKHIANALASGSERFEWTVLHRDGSPLPMEIFLTRIQFGDRQLIQAVCNDITVRKQAESELLQTLAREKELGQLRSNFVSMVSHEFRTPLGIIQSSTEILEDYFDRLEPSERAEHLQSIRKNTRRMAVMMEEVLLLGGFDAGRMEFRPAPLELRTFAQTLVDEVLSATAQKCSVELMLLEMPRVIEGDERLLRHIFTNLLTNAVKYSGAGRSVRFEIARVGAEMVCTIGDRGIGIPEADQEWLFNAFHRGHNVADRPGTGLGLVIVKRCVDLHRGTILLESKVGKGTTITVKLPIAGCAGAACQQAR